MAIKFKDLKKGEILSETQFYKVESISGNIVSLKTDTGTSVQVSKTYIESCVTSSSQIETTKEVSRTEAINILLGSANKAITVSFNTQVKEEDAKQSLHELYANKGGKILSETDYKKKVNSIVKSIITGKERTMIGRHYGNINEFGRLSFIDMEEIKDPSKPYENRTRQVDPRNLLWLIVDGIKYIVK